MARYVLREFGGKAVAIIRLAFEVFVASVDVTSVEIGRIFFVGFCGELRIGFIDTSDVVTV